MRHAVIRTLLLGLGLILAPARASEPRVRAIEIGPENTQDLPAGREADGIIGDFVLVNDRVKALVSGNLHQRKANMFTHSGAATPGCLYDLTSTRAENDQLTLFAPGGQEGRLSSVRILKEGGDEAVVRAEVTPATGGGLGRIHDYILRPGWRCVVVVSTYRNASDKPLKIKPAPTWKGLRDLVTAGEVETGLCPDPADRIGYAYAPLEWDGAKPARGEVELAPGQETRFAAALAVGNGAADAYGVLAALRGQMHRFRGRVADPAGHPAAHATLLFPLEGSDKKLTAFVGPDGGFDVTLPKSAYRVSVHDLGRPDTEAELKPDRENAIEVPAAAAVEVRVRDEAGRPLPCKVQFFGQSKKALNLGPRIRAHGCLNEYQTETGAFRQQLPPDRYRVVITRGIEYDHVEETIDVPAGKTVSVEATLSRVVDTRGWVSTDFHNHTTVSGDNLSGTDDRMINLAAEHIEFAPATEHNRIYDWKPHIDRLGLAGHVATITGVELTGSGPHLNSFPLFGEIYRQGNGAPEWSPDPRISALRLRGMPGDTKTRWVHLNHPDVVKDFNDANGDGKVDGGFQHLDSFIDAAEMFGEELLSGQPTRSVERDGKQVSVENRAFLWLQLLNAGHRIWSVAVTDSHAITGTGVGGWRTYLPSSSDEPAQINPKELIAHAKAGHSILTNGPFLEVKTSRGEGPGESVAAQGSITLKVRVQCNTWVDIDRVVVLANGRPVPECDFTRSRHADLFGDGEVQFQHEVKVPLKEDAHLIVVAAGEGSTLATGYGRSSQAKMHPVAYNNPIYVDTDGGGFKANGDTLGHGYLEPKQK